MQQFLQCRLSILLMLLSTEQIWEVFQTILVPKSMLLLGNFFFYFFYIFIYFMVVFYVRRLIFLLIYRNMAFVGTCIVEATYTASFLVNCAGRDGFGDYSLTVYFFIFILTLYIYKYNFLNTYIMNAVVPS